MEYSVLGIPNNSSLKDAQKALKEIRAKYHPDRRQNQFESVERQEEMRRFVTLAEEAFDRLKKHEDVNIACNSLMSVSRPSFDSFRFPMRFNSISDIFSNIQTDSSNATTHVETYSYSNVNGEIHESGTMNGRKLTKDELEKKKNKMKILL